MRCVFAFDRDDAVTSSPKTGPIPIEWVRHLAHQTDHEVWATGNQKLVDEADIPGTADLIERYKERWGDPRTHFEQRAHPKLERPDGLPRDAPDPDLVTAVYLHEGHPAPHGFTSGEALSRAQRLRLLAALFPDHDKHVVIDNKYLGYLTEWTHFYPQEFVEFVETVVPLLDVCPPEEVGLPDVYDWPDVDG